MKYLILLSILSFTFTTTLQEKTFAQNGTIANAAYFVDGVQKFPDANGVIEYHGAANLKVQGKCIANNTTANPVDYLFDWDLKKAPDSFNVSHDPTVAANSTYEKEFFVLGLNCTGDWAGSITNSYIDSNGATKIKAKVSVTFIDKAIYGPGFLPTPPRKG